MELARRGLTIARAFTLESEAAVAASFLAGREGEAD
jgi:hypothetical protein